MERANKGPVRAALYCAVILAFLLWRSYLRAAAIFLYDRFSSQHSLIASVALAVSA
jgi:hypothetical protein